MFKLSDRKRRTVYMCIIAPIPHDVQCTFIIPKLGAMALIVRLVDAETGFLPGPIHESSVVGGKRHRGGGRLSPST